MKVPYCEATTIAGEDVEGYYFYDAKNKKDYIMIWVDIKNDGLYDWDYIEIKLNTLKIKMYDVEEGK